MSDDALGLWLEPDMQTDKISVAKECSATIGQSYSVGSGSLVPKFGLLAPASLGGSVSARYFMPWRCHPSMAVTGAQCIASCLLTPGTVAQDLYIHKSKSPASIVLEHASGKIDVLLDYRIDNEEFTPVSAGIVRTARKLADGNVYVPASLWSTSAL